MYKYLYMPIKNDKNQIFLKKDAIFKNRSKSGFGLVLVQFWIQNRSLQDKLYRLIGSDSFFIEFGKSDCLDLVFPYSSTFEWYFEVRELDSQAQHEKIRPGSSHLIFWLAERPEQPF